MIKPLFSVFTLLACLFCAQTALALPVETRFGTLDEIVEYLEADLPGTAPQRNNSRTQLSVNGQQVTGIEGWFGITKVLNWGDKGDVVLLSLWSGGASCCHSYRLLHLTKSGFSLGPEFGDHGRDPSDFSITPAAITFRMERDFPADIDHWRLRYDDNDITITIVMENDTGVPAAGPEHDVLRWVAHSPHAMFETAGERVRFRSIMDQPALTHLRTTLKLGGKFTVSDGYLIASGCWPRRCNTHFGVIAIEVSTGQPFAAYVTDLKVSTYGAALASLPAPMRAAIQDNLRRSDALLPAD